MKIAEEGWIPIVYLIVMLCVACGCSQSTEPTAWQQAMRITGEEVAAKQDESLTILKENTTALTEIKEKVESLEASLVAPKVEPGKEVIKSAPEPPAKANDTQTSPKVATPGASQIASDGTRLRCDIDGDWNPTILETSAHLRAEHGVDTNGMTHQQMADIHADLHDGKTGGQPVTGAMFQNHRASAVTSQRSAVRSVSRGKSIYRGSSYSTQQSCPSGRCPQRR